VTKVRDSTTAICIFLLAIAAYAWLSPQSPENPQVITRLGLTLSIVESGRLDIDRFARRTEDKALYEAHYYADKLPGLSFLAIPVVAATEFVRHSRGAAIDSEDPADFALLAKTATIAVNALISALAAAALFLTSIRLGATRTGALFAAGALAFATPFFGWSTAFFAHSVSGSLLIFVAAGIAFAFVGQPDSEKSRPSSMSLGLVLGLLLGYTLVVDLTAAPACLLGAVLTLGLTAPRGGAVLFRTGSGLVLGGLLGLLPLLVYNQLAFGSPFTLGYSKVVGFEGMQQGVFGITWPRADVVMKLLFGRFRGLVPLAPVLVLVPVGLYRMWSNPETRVAAVAILVVLCSFLWINASYYYWWGGWSTGPRFLVPMLPICCLALAFAWPASFWARVATLILLAASLVLSLICALAGMFAPTGSGNTLVSFLLPRFLTPANLLRSLPIILAWSVFGLLAFMDTRTSSHPLGLDHRAVENPPFPDKEISIVDDCSSDVAKEK
jgi:hypothetical protein